MKVEFNKQWNSVDFICCEHPQIINSYLLINPINSKLIYDNGRTEQCPPEGDKFCDLCNKIKIHDYQWPIINGLWRLGGLEAIFKYFQQIEET